MLRGENAQSRRCRALVEDPTRRIANACDGEGLRELASGAERRVGVREIEEPYLAATEGQAQAVALDLGERSEPEAVGHLEHRVEPQRIEGADGRDVQRRGERDAERHDTVERAVEVERRVRTVLGRKACGDVEKRGGRREATLERRGVEEGLERRARLAGSERHVDLAAVEGIPVGRAADEREDPPAAGLDRHERRVGDVAPAELVEPDADEALGLVLQPGVERGLDDEAIASGEIRPHARELREREADELVRDRRQPCGKEIDRLRQGGVRLESRDPAVLGHPPEHVGLPRARGDGVLRRVVVRRPLRQAREIRRVREVEVA